MCQEDEYERPREYMEYAPSPRIIHTGPAYSEYPGRRTVFREHERMYGLPPDEVVYEPREGSHGREYVTYARPRYYGDDDQRPEVRHARGPQRNSATRGQSAADRFLEDLGETTQPPPTQHAETAVPEVPEVPQFVSPLPPNGPAAKEADNPPRQPAALHPRPPSTVSDGSRYEEYHHNERHIPRPDSGGPPRRAGPHRRRDRPHEYRMPSRYHRYMSAAREEPYGRGPSMSRSQSRRYEDTRRRIDQQETPQPTAETDYDPVYSREQSVEQTSPEDRLYARQQREYVSVQDRLHPHALSPPRYRYDEPRPPVYIDEYGYEVVRVRGEPRHPRGPYMSSYHQPPARYEQERYEYVPVPSYERPPPQRYNSRGEFMYYDERERDRPLPRRPVPAPEIEPEPYEAVGPEIKVESAPIPMPPEAP
jgi:hypothetical protein